MDRSILLAASGLVGASMLGAAAHCANAAWREQVARTNEVLVTVRRLEVRLAEQSALEARPAPPPASVLGTVTAPPPSGTPSDAESLARVNSLLDDSIARAFWGRAQAESFRELTPRLSDADRNAALQRLVSAINGGRVKVNTPGQPPF